MATFWDRVKAVVSGQGQAEQGEYAEEDTNRELFNKFCSFHRFIRDTDRKYGWAVAKTQFGQQVELGTKGAGIAHVMLMQIVNHFGGGFVKCYDEGNFDGLMVTLDSFLVAQHVACGLKPPIQPFVVMQYDDIFKLFKYLLYFVTEMNYLKGQKDAREMQIPCIKMFESCLAFKKK